MPHPPPDLAETLKTEVELKIGYIFGRLVPNFDGMLRNP